MGNSKEIFALALGLSTPWILKEVVFNKKEQQLDIYIDFIKGYKFLLEDGNSSTAHDTVERKWQHLNFFQHKCFLHARVPKVKTAIGGIKTVEVPWARKGSGFTLMFEAYSMLLIENEMPINKVGKVLKIYPNRIWTIFNHWIGIAHQKDEITDLKQIGFDETSIRKGHSYVTTMVDLKERRVLFVTKGKDSKCIKKGVEYLEKKGVDITKVKQLCIDMSPAFILGCNTFLPNSAITFDKFHVIKEVNKAMDTLRKLERKGNAALKNHKYTFLRNSLSPEQKSERDFLMEMYPKLGEGYRLKELFRDFWDMEDKEEAESFLAYWCDIAMDSGIFPFQRVVQTIKSHWKGIINYIKSQINNGILEGLNSKIQLAKKRARGYRNTTNFINMIYFICGKLKFDYPLLTT